MITRFLHKVQGSCKFLLRPRFIFNIFYFLFIISALGGCTLSMEEWTLPEEEKGFDEAITEESDYGTMTYQFREGVRSLTENVQEYIIRVENDSVLYFMDNTPNKWLPKVGDFVAAMCTPTIPFGLNHQVESVTNVGGMYKVVCKKASKDDIYKELEFHLDYEYVARGVQAFDSLKLDSLGIDPDELILEDYTLMEKQYGVKAMTRAGISSPLRFRETPSLQKLRDAGLLHEERLTRAETTTEDEPTKFLLDELGLNFNFGDNFSISFTGSVEDHNIQRVIYEENKAEDYSKQVTESHSYTVYDIGVKAAYGKGFLDDPKDVGVSKLKEISKNMKQMRKFMKEKEDKTLTFVNIRLPIPSSAFTLVIKFNGEVSVQGGLCGKVNFTSHHPVTTVTKIYDKGVKTTIPDEDASEAEKEKCIIQKGYTEVSDISIVGDLTFELSVRAAVGVEITGTGLGGDIGVKAGAGVTLVADASLYNSDSKTVQITKEKQVVDPYVFFEFGASFYWSPLGKQIASIPITIWKPTKHLGNIYLGPEVYEKNCKKEYKTLTDDNREFTVSICFNSLWYKAFPISKHTLIPRLRVYHGSYMGEYVEIPAVERWQWEERPDEPELEKYKTYDFHFQDKDLKSKEANYLCVPCIYDFNDDITYEFRESTMTFGQTTPTITQKKFNQRMGLNVNDYLRKEFSSLPADVEELMRKLFLDEYGIKKGTEKDLYYYQFGPTYETKDLGMMKNWGVKVQLKPVSAGKDDKYLLDKDVDVSIQDDGGVDVSKVPGKKTPVFNVITNYTSMLNLWLTPYVVDELGKKTYLKTSDMITLEMGHYKPNYDWEGDVGTMKIK